MNIELTDVARTFGRNKAVDGVSLAVGLGVFGLLGPNGAGKTSLLRMLATVLPPSSGTVRLLDRDPGKPAARTEIRRRLGYLPQNLGYYPSFTVAEFVEYFALLKEMPAHQVPKVVAAAVERVDLDPRAKARLRTLSGGMLRRVGIAQAIVNDPDLLLLDEPTAGLDPEQRVAFRTLIRDLGQHATVVVSTHLVEDVGTACSEVALMAEGKVVFRGTPDELTAQGEGHQVGDSPLERGYSADWEQGEQQDFITWFVSGPVEQDSPGPTPAQEAVAIALLAKIGAPVPQYPQFSQPSKQSGTSSASGASGTQPEASAAQITAAATRLESLSPAARRAWLTANIAALRAGTATLAQVP